MFLASNENLDLKESQGEEDVSAQFTEKFCSILEEEKEELEDPMVDMPVVEALPTASKRFFFNC